MSTIQAGEGGVLVWGMLYCHTLDLLVPINHCLKVADYLCVAAVYVHPFMTTIYHLLLAIESMIMYHVTKSLTGLMNRKVQCSSVRKKSKGITGCNHFDRISKTCFQYLVDPCHDK